MLSVLRPGAAPRCNQKAVQVVVGEIREAGTARSLQETGLCRHGRLTDPAGTFCRLTSRVSFTIMPSHKITPAGQNHMLYLRGPLQRERKCRKMRLTFSRLARPVQAVVAFCTMTTR